MLAYERNKKFGFQFKHQLTQAASSKQRMSLQIPKQ